MENGTPVPQRRTNFLLRQVIVPSWLQVILIGMYLYAFLRILITNPLGVIITFGLGFLFITYVLNPLRRRAGQATDAENDAEAEAAPTAEAAKKVRWRQLRTYQVWWLSFLILCIVLSVLESLGVATF